MSGMQIVKVLTDSKGRKVNYYDNGFWIYQSEIALAEHVTAEFYKKLAEKIFNKNNGRSK